MPPADAMRINTSIEIHQTRSSQPKGIRRVGPYPDDRGKYQTVGKAGKAAFGV
jgi:hypothetical protein